MNFADLRFMTPEAAVALTVVLALLVDLFGANKRNVARVAFAGTLVALALALDLHRALGELAPRRIFLSYAVDRYATFFKILILSSGALGILLAMHDPDGTRRAEGEHYTLFASMILAMALLSSATDLILIYVSLEFLSLTSYILAGFRKTKRASEGAVKYFLFGAAASGVMLFGMSYVYGLTGMTDLTELSARAALLPEASGGLFRLGAILMLAGFGFKVALVPFHFWSPDAYEGASTPVAALLSVGSKCAGFAVLGRVFFSVFPDLPLALPALFTALGVATMTLGNTAAIFQDDVKRMLAYSSVAQAGYLFIGFAAGGEAGARGMLYYLLAYLFMNMGAFAVLLVAERGAGTCALGSFAGLAARRPAFAAAMTLFLLALAGIPPTSGFVGKYLIFLAAMKSGFMMLAFAGILNSVVSIYYYFRVVRAMYFDAPAEGAAPSPVPAALAAVVALCAAATLVLGLLPERFHLFALGGIVRV